MYATRETINNQLISASKKVIETAIPTPIVAELLSGLRWITTFQVEIDCTSNNKIRIFQKI